MTGGRIVAEPAGPSVSGSLVEHFEVTNQYKVERTGLTMFPVDTWRVEQLREVASGIPAGYFSP